MPDNTTPQWGASVAEWAALQDAGLTPDLLPVVSNTAAKIHPASKMQGIGKTPSRYSDGMVVGIGGWTQIHATHDQVEAWAEVPDYGICIQTRRLRAIDIDHDDSVRAREIVALVTAVLGKMPMRYRSNSGKCLLVFWCEGELTKRIIRGSGGLIELLATGQQFVACGTHTSGARYQWDSDIADAPTLTLSQVDELWSGLAFEYGGGVSTNSKAGAQPTARRARGDTDDPVVDWLEAKGWVTEYSPDGRVDVRCPWEHEHSDGAGAPSSTSYYPAGVGGFASGNFKCLHAHCAHRGASDFLRATGHLVSEFEAADLPVTVANATPETERTRSARIGRGPTEVPRQRKMTNQQMIDELVYLTDGARVSFAHAPKAVLPFEEFKKAFAASKGVKTVNGKDRAVALAQDWLEHERRVTVRTQTFAPGQPAFCLSPLLEDAQNLWTPRADEAPENWQDLVAPFFQHVEYLVPDETERTRFLDWLAHIEQHPGTLPSTHYLLVAKQTGIGRNWLAYALARAFAGYTALGFNLAASMKTGFNGELSGSLLAVVDELHEGGPGQSGRASAEALKSMLTEATRRINPKYGRQHTEFNCCRFLMFSNHDAALPLADNDRRVVVLRNPDERQDAGYYVALYAMLDDPDLGPAIAHALGSRDISQFNPGSLAPMNEAKARAIRAGRSEVEQAVRDVARDWPTDCITSGDLTNAVNQTLGGKQWQVQGPAVAAGLVKYKWRVRVNGVQSHIWILRNSAGWEASVADLVRQEVEKGQQLADVAEFC